MTSQVNLHQHSDGSFLDGYARVTQIAERAKELGQSAVAITDHNECNQHVAFQKACGVAGIKPILGIEADWVTDLAATRETGKYPSNRSHICMLAQNNKGLSNLWALSSIAYTGKYHYHKPLVDPALMKEYSEGVYASDGCMITEFGRAVERGDEDAARFQYGTLLDIYGPRFYAELHTWQFMEADTDEKRRLNTLMTDINRAKVRMATEMGIPMVVVNDSHHARPEDWENKELVWQFNTHKKNGDQQQDVGQKADHLMGEDEIYHWMGRHGIPRNVIGEAIRNSSLIAADCNTEITKTLDMPRLTGSDQDDIAALMKSCEAGFRTRVTEAGLDEGQYFARLESELRLIIDKGFSGYFNVVADYTGAAKTGKWAQYVNESPHPVPLLVGPGRGSAGGCLVAYLLGITHLDPIRYDLLFDRFLTPGRKGFPDIDCDFPQSYRPGIKDYLSARFGHDHVCSIGTLTHSQPKAMLRDLCRANGVTNWDHVSAMSAIVEDAVKLLKEDDGEVSWHDIISERGGELAKWASQYPQVFEKLEEMTGVIRQSGVHPAGVLVSNKPLLGTVPTRVNIKSGTLITQFDMNEVEELGAVKFDVLGIRHLDTLMNARQLIFDRHGVWLDYDETGMPHGTRGTHKELTPDDFADSAIWPQIDKGHTVGIFQVETPNATESATQFRPRSESDVADLISIIRPGVKDAGLDKAYLRRRQGTEAVVYDHPLMEPIVGGTHGILVYQEQIIAAVQALAGFTPDEADDLRKALGKKNMEKLMPMKAKFQAGCRDKGIDAPAVERIWASIEASGRYAFNKSHAVGYALISTWEIWTKHYYPAEYLVALMATDGANINRYVREARKMEVEILPPDINLSDRKFTLGPRAIRYGLDTIRGLGSATVDEIMLKRPFSDVSDFIARVSPGRLGKSQVEALIKIGAFDSLNPDRHAVMTAYHDNRILEKVAPAKLAKMDEETRVSHVAAWREKHKDDASYLREFSIPDLSDEAVIYEIEKELVGTYVTVDPMGKYVAALDSMAVKSPDEVRGKEPGERFVIGGEVTAVKTHVIKKTGRFKDREMAFIQVTWNEQDYEVTAFPDSWARCRVLINEGDPVALDVKKMNRGCELMSLERLDLLSGVR